eukprot:7381201-Prymnesium_polylepis.3
MLTVNSCDSRVPSDTVYLNSSRSLHSVVLTSTVVVLRVIPAASCCEACPAAVTPNRAANRGVRVIVYDNGPVSSSTSIPLRVTVVLGTPPTSATGPVVPTGGSFLARMLTETTAGSDVRDRSPGQSDAM